MTGQRGVFVTLDGAGGVGKTTTADHLRRYLHRQGYAVHATAEPSRALLGQVARNTETYIGHALACLVAADRYHHLTTEIRPQLEAGRIVLCDRYVASSYVLQHIDGVPIEFLEAINSATDLPDLAVILTADPTATAGRIARRGAHSRFETGISASRAEVELYREATARLAERGFPLLTLDTTDTATAQVATLIAGRIAQLAGVPHADPATE